MTSHPALSADRMAPPTPGQLRRLLAAEHLRPRKALSQNFLTDAAALDAIVAAAELKPGDRVLEVGPGLGVLTRRVLAAGASVLAVELDPRLAAWLRRELGEVPGFDLIEADALTLHPREVFPSESFKLVANIPYHITSPLLHAFLEGERPPEVAVLLVQAEVAERVAAPPGQMSYLSVFVQNIARAEVVSRVPAAAFEPAPDVDSAILRLRRRAEPPVPLGSGREPFYRVVQAGFRQRRKQIHNGLGRELPVGSAAVADALVACGIDGERRPQTLSVEEWSCLATQLEPRLASASPDGTEGAGRRAARTKPRRTHAE
jgi:16S rRNA (adenine1518-N6/adenine1519-N6)-dimethyltransferase